MLLTLKKCNECRTNIHPKCRKEHLNYAATDRCVVEAAWRAQWYRM